MTIFSALRKTVLNLPGWHTTRKIVVFESDDWGSFRIPNRETYNKLLENGIRVDKCKYLSYDSLETNSDLEALFEVLLSVRDKNNLPAKLTANTIMTNPDFERIKSEMYQQYYFKPFYEDLDRFPKSDKIVKFVQQGISSKVYQPQFHGREHVNITRWMADLNRPLNETNLAFEFGVYGLSSTVSIEKRKNYMPALDYDSMDAFEQTCDSLVSGLKLFRKHFGFESKSFIAPAYTWSEHQEAILAENGVAYLQGNPFQKNPELDRKSGKKKVFHYLGEKNHFGQRYLVRNAYFEPTLMGSNNTVQNCLKQIANAFFWKRPGIVGCHRLNFMGGIDESNRDLNLRLFKNLLKEIVKKWPEVEFLSSDQLGDLINR